MHPRVDCGDIKMLCKHNQTEHIQYGTITLHFWPGILHIRANINDVTLTTLHKNDPML